MEAELQEYRDKEIDDATKEIEIVPDGGANTLASKPKTAIGNRRRETKVAAQKGRALTKSRNQTKTAGTQKPAQGGVNTASKQK